MTVTKHPIVIYLMGPTASGKTRLASELTQNLPADIISVDSAMVYRGMDIGTAKPTPEEQALASHRLIDICDPSESYSAGQFRQDALIEIEKILQQERIPLLVGGTMLYFHVLQRGLAELPTADEDIREKIALEAAAVGWEKMHAKLATIDPIAATRIHPHDPQRISRALEVYKITGKTLSGIMQAKHSQPLPYRFINLAIAPAERAVISERVEKRFDNMLQQGLVEEVEKLYRRGDLHADLPAIRAVGYRQVWEYLAGSLTYDEMRERGIIATRQLAKRQLTWLRSWENVQLFDSEKESLLEQIMLCVTHAVR